ncbi:hypothetical protein GUITHDRAFT_74038, partial [Guillardia theta CCMP2712]
EMNRRIFQGKLPKDLIIGWSTRLNTTAGVTIFKRNKNGGGIHGFDVHVELSTKVIDDTEKLRQTLCHELCHVAAWVVNGTRKPPHGKAFKYWASISAARYPGIKVTTCHNYEIAYKYRYQCVLCHKEYGRHSKSINVETARCGVCRGTLMLLPKLKADGTPCAGDGDGGRRGG